MVRFKYVKMSNFLSFGQGEVTVDLDTKSTRAILGRNEDIGDSGNSGNGVGKCLGKDTPVMLHDGKIVFVQDVKIGDVLMGDDGSPRKVLSLARGREELFEVKQNNGMSYVVNRSHILSLRAGTTRTKYGFCKGDIVNIPVYEYLKLPASVKTSLCGYIGDLKKLDNKIEVFEPWLIGLWLADGTTDKPQISYHIGDSELYENVRWIVKKHSWDVGASYTRGNCLCESYVGGFSSKLRDIGVLGNKHIPTEYLLSSYEQRLELLAGILDGDGHNNRGRSIDIVLKKTQLAEDVVFLARSVGLRVKVSDKFSKCQNFEGDVYTRLTITGDITKIPHRLTRKQGTGIPGSAKPRFYGSTGISVTSLGDGEYYGFEIDGNRLFCLGDMTVTHNTSIFNAIIFALYGKGVDKLKADEYINIVNGKKLVVELCFEKDGKVYVVRRGRKPNFVEMTEDGVSLTLDAMRNTDDAISSLVGFNYDIFMAAFFLSPHRQSFMAMSGPEQRSMIENMLSLDVLATRAAALKSIRDDVSVDLKIAEKDILRFRQSNSSLEETRMRLLENAAKFEENRKNEIASKSIELDDLKSVDLVELQEIYNEYLCEKDTVAAAVVEETRVRAELKDASAEYNRLKTQKETIESLIEKAESFKERMAGSVLDATEFLDKHAEVSSYETVLAEQAEASGKASKLREHITATSKEISYESRERDRIQSLLEKTSTEIESHLSGRCHVCGGEFSNKDHLESLEREMVSLEHTLAGKNRKIAELETDKLKSMDEVDSIRATQLSDMEILEIRKTVERVKKCENEVKNAENAVNPYEKELSELDSVDENELFESKARLDRKTAEHDALVETVATAKDSVNSYETVLGELRVYKQEHIDELSEKISKLEREVVAIAERENAFYVEAEKVLSGYVDISELETSLADLQKKEKHIGYLIKLLTDSKSFIRKRILENYVPYLNKKINEYAYSLGLPHVCEINPDLTVDLTYMSRGVSYYNLSRGERLRLDMATTVAFRDVMAMLGKGCNLSLLDEVLDSALDASGIHAALKFICSSAETVLLVTHREELSAGIDEKMFVVKSNGFSRIE